MAELVLEGIKMVLEIKDVVSKFYRNNTECARIRDTVEKLSDDLNMLREVSVMQEHQSVREALQRLNDTLKETVREVKECQNTNALLRLFQNKDITYNLDRLRKDVYEKMLSAVLLIDMSTNLEVQNVRLDMNSLRQEMSTNSAEMHNVRQDVNSLRQEMRTNSAEMKKAVAAIFKHLGISNDASNENRTGTEKTDGASTELRQYIRWSDLMAATHNKIILKRKGCSSSIYKAELDKRPIAIKKFHEMDERVRARIVHELRLVRKLHQHPNVVKLLGCCFEYNESLVVEDNDVKHIINGVLGFISRYMSKESMAEVFIKGNEYIVWPSLLRIIREIAKGISYLHIKNVVHLDLRPENILFDDMIPMINNFGKAQQFKDCDSWIELNEEQLPGAGKYVAPELSASTGSSEYRASTKSDVYSFGVILLELIGLTCATSKNRLRPRDPEQWAKRMQESELVDLFNPQRITSDTQRTAARWCVIVGLLCCLPDPEERPSMWKVIAMLGLCEQEEEMNSTAATTTRSPQGNKVQINLASSSSTSSSSILLYDSNSTSVRNNELVRYKVLTDVMLREQQDKEISSIVSVLSFVPGVAELLLRHNRWSHEKFLSEWCDKEVTLRKDAGLPTQGHPVTITMMKESIQRLTCLACKESFNAGQMWSADCGHFYCQRCWGDHIGMAASVWIECMFPSCKKPVVRELVEVVARKEVKMQYDGLLRRSYVDDSGARRKWCPICNDRAVELLGDGASGSTTTTEVKCECTHRFCWKCLGKPHQPHPCYYT